jgi:hypothetical protein
LEPDRKRYQRWRRCRPRCMQANCHSAEDAARLVIPP